MAGLAEILEENARLRALIEARDTELRQREAALVAQAEAHALEREEWARQLALNEQIIEALQQRAEELARALELLALKTAGPASERFVSEETPPVPFVSDIAPPPRAPVSTPEPEPDDLPAGTPSTKKRGAPKRPRLQEQWKGPRRTVRCRAALDAACVRCGSALSVLGQTVSYRMEWEPGRFVLEEVVRDKCACRACPGEGVLTVPGPYALERAQCGNGLLARVLIDKFSDHRVPRRRAQQPKGRRSKSCCMDDEGRSLGIGMQVRVSNHHELRGSRVRVVSVVGKGAGILRQVRSKKTSASEPLMTCREESTRRRNREG